MSFINALVSHVWQSTLFAAAVALLILTLRENQARWRCRLWLAASLKFLIPFSSLAALGSRLGWHTVRLTPSSVSMFVEDVSRTITSAAVHQVVIKAPAMGAGVLPRIVFGLWFLGFAFTLFRWLRNWTALRATVRAAVPLEEGREFRALRRIERIVNVRRPIQLRASAGRLEPGVFGLFQTVLLWPAGISERLADSQLEAIMAHEICHARRRDNLAAALHMMVECIFWFHPLVWWLGARLVDEREKACDEEVLQLGSEPEAYAESILKTCQFYLESPRWCMAGVTGSDLKARIERIMSRRVGRRLDLQRKLLLAAAAIAAVAGPIGFGIATAPAVKAQSARAGAPAFEVASIRPNNSDDHRVMFKITPGGRLECTNVSPKMLIIMAYNLKPNQLSGGPSWMDSVKYDITAKADGPDDPDRLKLMMQTLLADRFKLAVHKESKEMPIFELVVAKGGPKLQASAISEAENKGTFQIGRGQMDLSSVTLPQLADNLSRVLGRNVYDKTGIRGAYDVKLEWTPDEGETPELRQHGGGDPPPAQEPTGPSLAAVLQERLGLKLVAAKGPVDMVVVDRIEKASEN